MSEVIWVEVWVDEETRTRERTCFYTARCVIGGVVYEARSRNEAANELARVLVAAGIADAEMRVGHWGQPGHGIYRSFHAAARWTYAESASAPLRRVRWVDPAVRAARFAEAFFGKAGSNDLGRPAVG